MLSCYDCDKSSSKSRWTNGRKGGQGQVRASQASRERHRCRCGQCGRRKGGQGAFPQARHTGAPYLGVFSPPPARTDGEASNPGPKLAMGNCTSLNTQLEAVLHLDADILGLSEVRLTTAGQRQHEALLEQRAAGGNALVPRFSTVAWQSSHGRTLMSGQWSQMQKSSLTLSGVGRRGD